MLNAKTLYMGGNACFIVVMSALAGVVWSGGGGDADIAD